MNTEMKQSVAEAELVLIGLGMEFSEKHATESEIKTAYENLAEILSEKNYFIVTLNTDDEIYKYDFIQERIVAPCGSDKTGNVVTNKDYDESGYLPQWENYMKWLQGTVNKKLCILELGVGFEYPSVIRFAFEKVAFYNQKCKMFRVHSEFAQLTPEIKERCMAISENPIVLLQNL